MNCIILKKGKCEITQNYSNNHQAIDIVGENHTLDDVIAHSDGKVIFYQDGYSNLKGSKGNLSYGNCIKIDHGNGYYTLYAHLEKDLNIKNNEQIKKGQIIGKMSDSGNAYGKHLHFEVWKNNQRINPDKYLDSSFEQNKKLSYSVNDIVKIDGVYESSTSKNKLTPLITEGKITRIIENAINPYLLEIGKIGWTNEENIISVLKTKYLSNKNYKGFSIVDALNQINVDSSFDNRSRLAKINEIKNYKGTSIQNTNMLNLLKQGILKSYE